MLLFHVAVGSPQDETPNKAASEQVTARQDRFYRALYSTLSQPSIIGGGKHLTMYFNLLYKAMKNDCNSTRVIAFAKRLLCTTMHTNPPVTAASLFLLNEIMKHHDELKSCFVDIAEGQNAMAVLDPSKREPMAALTVMDGDSQDTVAYAHLWETSLIVHHFHPSVAKFAAGDIEYTGDPLRDFALAPFLDKFAYRNPKTAKKRGESVAERRKSAEDEMTLPVNDPSFLKRQDVDVQEEFFHKFFVERARRDEMKGIVRGGSEADDEDEAFDIAENFNTDQTVSANLAHIACDAFVY
jgi:ribosome biogenesis protein MAK21